MANCEIEAALATKKPNRNMAPQKIKQWKSGQDGLDKLYMEETDIPTPGEDEVLVEIHSVSLNYRDTEGTSNLIERHATGP